MMAMWQWLRRRFVTGFFVTVPIVVSVVAIVWVVRWADRVTSGLGERAGIGHVPGIGLVATAVIVLSAGVVATNVLGRRLLERAEQLLLHVPFFRTVYAPVKQRISAFSPENEGGFKRVVLVEDATGGFVLGFLTREFLLERGRGAEPLLAVYIPTNHLYLGDIRLVEASRVSYPDISVEEGLSVFLTGGMGLPPRVRTAASLATTGRPRGG